MRRFEESILCCFSRSFSAELFPFAFIDYDGKSQSNEGSLHHFNCNCHWASRKSPSCDWIILLSQKVLLALLFLQCQHNTMAVPIFLSLALPKIAELFPLL